MQMHLSQDLMTHLATSGSLASHNFVLAVAPQEFQIAIFKDSTMFGLMCSSKLGWRPITLTYDDLLICRGQRQYILADALCCDILHEQPLQLSFVLGNPLEVRI